MQQRIYLDNAATSWPKPEGVYAAVDHYQREVGAPSGRGTSRAAEEVTRSICRTRRGIAELLEVNDLNRVVFTNSGTDSLNMAILGLLRPGDHVVTTVCEHNSVLRPLRFLIDTADVEVTYVKCDGEGFIDPAQIRNELRSQTRLVAIVHGSNVTGSIQPIDEIGKNVREHGAYFLIDAAQTLGEVPISMEESGADIIAAPGHKGLLGPLGTGVLALSERVVDVLRPLRFGGTGTSSEDENQPKDLPQKYEAGNLNVPGLMGLAAAMDFLAEQGVCDVRNHQMSLTERLLSGLAEIGGVIAYGSRNARSRTSVVSFTVAGYDPQEFAGLLELTAGIECRAGIHCAPKMHQALGTLNTGGTIRLSPGCFTTTDEIDMAISSISMLAAESVR